ncbi:MgtC/SapB family protein [Thiococcus pfennigii]|uniref:MgtC/SapB family protein n=1 Tax=Thiococcus pfennigii TaxID=1057 RepID=UPI0019080197|nr:MgtC/SapB family protein [Thiococcus pfennigii]MBK1700942.1 hypothetical protein [Thiococcus pfennigii]
MDGTELFWRLALALGIGFLIGIERGRHTRDEGGGVRIAGVRTFALMGLLGGVSAALARDLGGWVLAATLVTYGALVIAAHVLRTRELKDFGITTEVAELLVFLLGAMAVIGDATLAAAGAVATLALLSAKPVLHRWVQQIKRLELTAAVELLVLSVVLLPVLPNRGFGPGEVLNPYELWWLVVLVAGISFAGYFAMKLAGPRSGLFLTAVLGGLASSTALTISFAKLGRSHPGMTPLLAAGIALAAGIMFVRLLVLVGLVNGALVEALAWPVGLALLASLMAAALLGLEARGRDLGEQATHRLANPSEVATALTFGAMLAGIILLSYYVQEWLGDAGLYALAAVAGLADADAISLSFARMGLGAIAADVAVRGIVIAAVVNTLVKLGIVAALAPTGLTKRIGAVTAAIAAAAGIGLVWS